MRTSHEPVTVKAAILFFLPLIFMMELHQISHAVIHAFLARLSDPKAALAAFSLASSLHYILSFMMATITQTGISFIVDRASFWRLIRFSCLIAIFPFTAIETISLTSLGDMIFGGWIGASAHVVRQARIASAIMAFRIFFHLLRNFAYALAFINRRTILITYGTGVRLAAIGVSLLVYPFWLDGAVVGGAAFVSCMAAEATYMAIFTYPFYTKLPLDSRQAATYSDMWRFSWPLMTAQSVEGGVPFIVNLFLGKLSKPDLAIAAYGVVNALAKVIISPLKNLVQTIQTLLRSKEDLSVLIKFSVAVQLFFVGVIFVLFYTSLRGSILEGVMGLTLELSRYATPGLKLVFIMSVFGGFSSVFRGMLSAIRSTSAIAATSVIRLLVITVVCSTTLFFPDLNGTLVGVLAMGSAFMAESLVLGWRLYVKLRRPESIFAHMEI